MATQIRASHPEHLLLAAAIALGPFREHRDYSLGLAIIWLSLHWIQAIWNNRHASTQRPSTILPGIALGLLLIQSRMLLTMSDHEGPSRYLLIAFALLVGSSLSPENWKRLLQWITAGTLALGAILYWGWHQEDFTSLALANKYFFREGLGGINMLGTVMATLTVCGVYSLRISQSILSRAIAIFSFLASYSLCLATNSRLAAVTPLLAVFFAWLFSEGLPAARNLDRKKKFVTFFFFALLPSLAILHLAILPDLSKGFSADNERLEIWKCSIKNSILSGNNRIVYGNGFDWTSIRNACGQWQAHSSYIHFLSMHGILGLISLLVILIIISKGIRLHLMHRALPRSLWRSSWGEVALGSSFIVMLTGITSTTYLGGYINPLLIGLMLSTGVAPLSGHQLKPEPDQGGGRINPN